MRCGPSESRGPGAAEFCTKVALTVECLMRVETTNPAPGGHLRRGVFSVELWAWAARNLNECGLYLEKNDHPWPFAEES